MDWSRRRVRGSAFATGSDGRMTADGVVSFAHSRDLVGPAAALFASSVNGGDLLTLTQDILVKDVRLTPFAARKVVAACDAPLVGS